MAGRCGMTATTLRESWRERGNREENHAFAIALEAPAADPVED
jgi:hypothetical protein